MGSRKRFSVWIALLSVPVLFTACHSAYDITLNNGNKITGVSKPVLDKKTGEYQFKTSSGKVMYVKSIRVREIGPHEAEDSKFVAPPAKK